MEFSNNTNTNHKDRLSNLPDVLLHQIHFYLDLDTRQIVQRSLLSKRWKYLWVSSPTLDFDLSKGNLKSERIKFLKFIDRIIRLRDKSCLQKFILSYAGHRHEPQFKTWINYAISRRAQELHLHHLALPIASFDDVKILKLIGVSFSCSRVLPQDLVLNLPGVEFLVLEHCHHGVKILTISAPQLRNLFVNNSYYKPECQININAPNLTSIQLKGYLYDDYFIGEMFSLVTAEFCESKFRGGDDTDNILTKCSRKVLNALANAENLILSAYIFKNFPLLPHELAGQKPFSFDKVKHLKLLNSHECDSSDAIEKSLQSFPSVETLVFTNENKVQIYKSSQSQRDNYRDIYRDDYWGWPQRSIQCIYSNLKSVEVHLVLEGHLFEEYQTKYGTVLTFLEYMLGSSPSLESLTVRGIESLPADVKNTWITNLQPKAISRVNIIFI